MSYSAPSTPATDRIRAVLVVFQGEVLTVRQIAQEAEVSVSWTYVLLARLEAEAFVARTYRDAQGFTSHARLYSVASRDVAADHEAAEQASYLAELEAEMDASDLDAQYLSWAIAA